MPIYSAGAAGSSAFPSPAWYSRSASTSLSPSTGRLASSFVVRNSPANTQAPTDPFNRKAIARLQSLIEEIRRLVEAPAPSPQAASSQAASNIIQQQIASLVPVQIGSIISTTELTGINNAQVVGATVNGLPSGGQFVIQGTVTHSQSAARLSVSGDEDAMIPFGGTYELSGNRGSMTLDLSAGESLLDVAERINQNSSAIGVTASVVSSDLILTSTDRGRGATVQFQPLDVENRSVFGVNPSQIDHIAISALTPGTSEVLNGSFVSAARSAELTYRGATGGLVAGTAAFRLSGSRGNATFTITAGEPTRKAAAAELAVQGGANSTVIDSATFELTGSAGRATVNIQQGESLAAVAGRINAAVNATGVVAQVSGNQLVLKSTDVGSSAQVGVELLHVAHTNVISGIDSQQVTAFAINQFTEGATHTLSGSVTQTAGKAELTFTGNFLSLVGRNATFTLSGSQGSAQISVTAFQTVSSLANQINQTTTTTGVTAVVQGNQVKLRSVGVGSTATVRVQVTSGTFNVTGGNGSGTAIGANAIAVVNGQTITGLGNQFQFSDSLGSYSFTVTSGFIGAFAPVSIVSQAGYFTVSGGDGSGVARGLDALATINGQDLTGSGNRFAVSQSGGQFELEFAAGFTGQFDPIIVRSTPQPFEIDGGDEAGTDTGSDALALINGSELTSSDNRFNVQGTNGAYVIEFADGFAGQFDPITITSTINTLETIGGDEDGLAYGADAEAVINGQHLVGSGSRFQFVDGGITVSLAFLPDFEGPFDPITATSRSRTLTRTILAPQTTVRRTTNDLSGTNGDGLPSAPAKSPVEKLLHDVDNLAASVIEDALPSSDSPASEARIASRPSIWSEQLAKLYQGNLLPTPSTFDFQHAQDLAHVASLIDLLA